MPGWPGAGAPRSGFMVRGFERGEQKQGQGGVLVVHHQGKADKAVKDGGKIQGQKAELVKQKIQAMVEHRLNVIGLGGGFGPKLAQNLLHGAVEGPEQIGQLLVGLGRQRREGVGEKMPAIEEFLDGVGPRLARCMVQVLHPLQEKISQQQNVLPAHRRAD